MSTPETPTGATGGWTGRPAGTPAGVPPPSVPLSFLAAAALGLVACGVAVVLARSVAATDPTNDLVVGAAHFAMLATLSMGVLGAIHQFTPVITQRPLRSVRLSRATFLSWLAGSWLLPIGFMTRHEVVVELGGACAAVAVALFVVNVAPPLRARGKGAPTVGLRLSVIGFVVTAGYGVVYVIDRRGEWFDLNGHVILAHACVGLLAWLGLTYLSVSEKLWPMFMLSHVPGRRRGAWIAIGLVFSGVALLSPGLLFALWGLAVAGAALVVAGLGAHLWSLARYIHHRRRPVDLHVVFVLSSAAWLIIATVLGVLSAIIVHLGGHRGGDWVAATVAALAGWLLVALVGHAHKIVPFIAWSALRSRGVTTRADGTQLMFADLFNHGWATLDCVLVNASVAGLVLSFALGGHAGFVVSGALLVATGLTSAGNLAWRPTRLTLTASRGGGAIPASVAVPAPRPPRAPDRSR
ncbi:MAG: hypothetical protein ACYCRG_01800 [Acidimicrobiales bacterium]